MIKRFKFIIIPLLFFTIMGLCIIGPFNYTVKAIENDNVLPAIELKPSFSALTVDITEPLIISYENIDLENYECSIDAEGVNVSITDDIDFNSVR